MSQSPSPSTPPARPAPAASAWFAVSMLAIGCIGAAAVWIMVALSLHSNAGWMAAVAAVDVALLLRLGRVRPGALRAVTGALATTAVIALACWCIAAMRATRGLALGLWEAATGLGAEHALTITVQGMTAADVAWLVSGMLIALVISR